MIECTPISTCLCCNNKNLIPILDMGYQPLANNYKCHILDNDPKYPLALNKCNSCFHLQLSHKIDSTILFNEYSYYSGISETFKKYCSWFANYVDTEYPNKTTILDIGCNDGTQLNYFKALNFVTVGVDPAKNIYETSSKNHDIFCSFFDKTTSDDLLSKYPSGFDIIICQNSFAHTANHIDMLTNIKRLMHNETKLIIQTSQSDMLLYGQIDTIYHEHVSFFNINSMKHLCDLCGLYLTRVMKTEIHGSSYIFTIEKVPNNIQDSKIEESFIFKDETYTNFVKMANNIVNKTTLLLHEFRQLKYDIIGYGAAAKGNTFINYSGINLDCIIDDTPQKQNKFTPGSNIPIVSSEILQKIDKPIVFVILPWNFYDEIKMKIKLLRGDINDLYIRYYPNLSIES